MRIYIHFTYIGSLKSVNLQYITLACLDDGTNKSSTKHLMFQVIFFFHDFLQNSLQKSFHFIFLFFYKITKIKIKSFECPKNPSIYNILRLGCLDDGTNESSIKSLMFQVLFFLIFFIDF